MGGMAVWSELKSLSLVHEWFPWHRVDSHVENEVLDLQYEMVSLSGDSRPPDASICPPPRKARN